MYAKVLMDLIAVGSQATGFFLWPLLHPEKQINSLVIPITVFCISCGYWENYTTKHTLFGKLNHLGFKITTLTCYLKWTL